MVTLELDHAGTSKSLTALADTGCTGGLVLTKRQVALHGINLENWEKENDSPEPIMLGDNRIIGSDIYRDVHVKIGEEPATIRLLVLDPDTPFKVAEDELSEVQLTEEDEKEREQDEKVVVIGHGYLGNYDALFSGPQKKLILLKTVEDLS